MRPFRILSRNIRDAFKSVLRNFSLSMASIACIMITLVLVAVAMILSNNVDSFIRDLQSELTIVVYVEKDTNEENIRSIENRINDMKYVEEVIYSTKEEVRQEMMAEYDSFKTLMEPWTDETNPLLHRFKIKVNEVDEIKNVAESIKKIDNVYSVTYGEKVVEQMIPVFKTIERAAVVMVVALVFITAFLISNTIKLTIYSRREEIEIMRLVGTSNVVIRLPFVFEGLILGVIGAIIPILVTTYGYILVYDYFNGYILSNIFALIKPTPFVFILSGILIAIGALVGMFGSYRAVRKYLKV